MEVAAEFASAVRWQAHSYQHPPRTPSLEDPSIVWEQSIVEGHPTHPVCSHLILHQLVLWISQDNS